MILKVDFLGVTRPSFGGGGSFCTECGGFVGNRFSLRGPLSLLCVRFPRRRLCAPGLAPCSSFCSNCECYQMTPSRECKMSSSNCSRSVIWSLAFTFWPLGEETVTSFKLLLYEPHSPSFPRWQDFAVVNRLYVEGEPTCVRMFSLKSSVREKMGRTPHLMGDLVPSEQSDLEWA